MPYLGVTVLVSTFRSPYASLRPVPIESVKINDEFWAPKIRRLVEVTLPSQYELMEETGRLDNFRRAAGKLDKPFQGFFFNDSDVYKWVEATSLAMAYDSNPELATLLDTVIKEIVDAQDEDGYLNTYFTFEKRKDRWSNLRDMHELYCAGHLFQAAIAHHRATSREDLLRAALRFADHIVSVFGPGKRLGVSGHPEIEMALVELYREVGKREYLELAEFFIDQRGKGLIGGSPYHIDHKPFKELDELVGHAVRALYLCCGAADVYMERGDEDLRKTLERLWDNMVRCKMYVTGGVGSRHEGEAFGDAYELPNERSYAETCAAIANVMWNWRMFLMTGEAKYVDVMELALYNGALAGISFDGKHYFYVNPLASRGKHRRQRWFDCACCPPNIARLIASIPGLVYAKNHEGVWVNLYVASRADVELRGGRVKVLQRTEYPWSGDVELEIRPEKVDEFSLFLRIPSWCGEVKVTFSGEQVREVRPGSYLEIHRAWNWGDVVKVIMDMRPEFLISHPYVTSNTCRAAIRRGPLIYCLEQADNPGYDVWNLAVLTDEELSSERREDLFDGVVVVKGKALYMDLSYWRDRLYARLGEVKTPTKVVEFTAVPYFLWANREPGPMIVWFRRCCQTLSKVDCHTSSLAL